MKGFCKAAVCLVVLGVLAATAQAQPLVPREKIPAGIPADVRTGIEGLYAATSVQRIEAATSLGEMGAKAGAATPFLVSMLREGAGLEVIPAALAQRFVPSGTSILGTSSGTGVFNAEALSAQVALGRLGKPALPALLDAAKSETPGVRPRAVWALGVIKEPAATQALIAMLKDSKFPERVAVVEAIGLAGDPKAVDPLLVVLRDGDPDVRQAAGEAIGRTGDPRAVDLLLVALKDETREVRAGAAAGLGHAADARAVEPLIAALQDTAWQVRSRAVEALGAIKDPRAVEPLIRLLTDKEGSVAYFTNRALVAITKVDHGDNPTRWATWWKEQQKKDALSQEPIRVVPSFELIATREVSEVEGSAVMPGGGGGWQMTDPSKARGLVISIRATFPPGVTELDSSALVLSYATGGATRQTICLGVTLQGSLEKGGRWFLADPKRGASLTLNAQGSTLEASFLYAVPPTVAEVSLVYKGKAVLKAGPLTWK
jgi:HEAT repeat protein